MRQHFDRPQTPRHVDRLLPDPHAVVMLARQHVQLRPVAQRHASLRVVAERREDVQRLFRATARLFRIADEPGESREPPQVAPDRARVVELAPQAQRLGARVARRQHVAGQMALVAELIEQRRARLDVEALGPRQGGAIVRGRLAMRADRGRLLRGLRRKTLHGAGVCGADGVVYQSR